MSDNKETKQAWAPDRIWLQRGVGDDGSHTWCSDSQDEHEQAEYVRVDVQAPVVEAGARDERPVDPDDIDAVSEAIQRECGCEWEVAQRCAVAAIDTLIARGNHSAALSRASEVGQVSKGWKLVPAEPTVEMLNAALPHDVTFGHGFKRRIYQEMLAASPTAPSGAQDERGAFEHIERASNLERDDEGDYVNPCVQSAWEGFQKGCGHARAASTPANVAKQGATLTECTIKQIGHRFGAIYEDRISFYDDKFTEFCEALAELAAPTPVADGGAADDLRAIQAVLRELDPKWRERGEFGVVAREQIIAAIRYLAAPQPASEPKNGEDGYVCPAGKAQAAARQPASEPITNKEKLVEIIDWIVGMSTDKPVTNMARRALELLSDTQPASEQQRYVATTPAEVEQVLDRIDSEQQAARGLSDDDDCPSTPASERAAFNAMMRWHLIRLLQAWRYAGDMSAAALAAFEWARTNNVGKEAFKASERAVKIAAKGDGHADN